MRRPAVGLLTALLIVIGGCAAGRPSPDVMAQAGGSAALFKQFAAYETNGGARLSLDQLVSRLASADVVFFGEEHGNVVCNQLQAQLLDALNAHHARHALAMEFFEADTQAALDAYLDGKLDEPDFLKQTRQGRGYWTSHRPLIELSRAAGTPVLAVNAPRRLVRAFRISELEYDTFYESLSPEDRRWAPSRSPRIGGPYQERFFKLMGGHDSDPSVPDDPMPMAQPASMPATMPAITAIAATMPSSAPAAPESQPAAPESQPALPESQPAAPESQPASAETQPAPPAPGSSVERFFRSQLMWDDAMAESIANHRKRHPAERVMLIVGSFHVAREGGTVRKYLERRPKDRTLTVVFVGAEDGNFPLRDEDRDAGDFVIYGITPPPAPEDSK